MLEKKDAPIITKERLIAVLDTVIRELNNKTKSIKDNDTWKTTLSVFSGYSHHPLALITATLLQLKTNTSASTADDHLDQLQQTLKLPCFKKPGEAIELILNDNFNKAFTTADSPGGIFFDAYTLTELPLANLLCKINGLPLWMTRLPPHDVTHPVLSHYLIITQEEADELKTTEDKSSANKATDTQQATSLVKKLVKYQVNGLLKVLETDQRFMSPIKKYDMARKHYNSDRWHGSDEIDQAWSNKTEAMILLIMRLELINNFPLSQSISFSTQDKDTHLLTLWSKRPHERQVCAKIDNRANCTIAVNHGEYGSPILTDKSMAGLHQRFAELGLAYCKLMAQNPRRYMAFKQDKTASLMINSRLTEAINNDDLELLEKLLPICTDHLNILKVILAKAAQNRPKYKEMVGKIIKIITESPYTSMINPLDTLKMLVDHAITNSETSHVASLNKYAAYNRHEGHIIHTHTTDKARIKLLDAVNASNPDDANNAIEIMQSLLNQGTYPELELRNAIITAFRISRNDDIAKDLLTELQTTKEVSPDMRIKLNNLASSQTHENDTEHGKTIEMHGMS